MKSKLKTQKKICYLHELNEIEKSNCNRICNIGFSDDLQKDYISLFEINNPIVSLLYFGDIIIGVCFADINENRVIKPLSNLYLYLHSISIHPLFRGYGLCYHLVKNLLDSKINIKGNYCHLGKSFNMLLHVRTNYENPNISAIKCYEKNGFKLVDMIHEIRNGEINTAMIRKKSIKTKKRKTKKKTKKRKT